LINVALSRAKARLVVILSVGDHANEYLRRIAQVISGDG
jgi:superfamily I DNA and/or RNA helicase